MSRIIKMNKFEYEKLSIMKQITLVFLFILSMVSCTTSPKSAGVKPNIIWIMMEDWGYELSCYGAEGVHTPNIDQFAADGIRYTVQRNLAGKRNIFHMASNPLPTCWRKQAITPV
jgi:hypothetical protein